MWHWHIKTNEEVSSKWSPVWTFVASSLGEKVPAAESVTLLRFRNHRKGDLEKSAAIWNPLREPEKMVAVQHSSLPHKRIIYQMWQCRSTHKHTQTVSHTFTIGCFRAAAVEDEAQVGGERTRVSTAMLSGYWWMRCRVHSVIRVPHTDLTKLQWQCHNPCIRVENGVVCQRLSWLRSDSLQCPICSLPLCHSVQQTWIFLFFSSFGPFLFMYNTSSCSQSIRKKKNIISVPVPDKSIKS